ncbi:response regulator [Pseudodesulfovibrio sp.]|uniref:response regulator n=1 Tax=Pseudodesulfovibrio sp. TaxID=2035812 RepID=UPI002610FC8C|nr:response regulator [Pseudodesulfovibrio sp.]MDD3311742.1 response regulator [Pseudodesulfovibrio sp.]
MQRKILFVDDDQSILDSFRTMLHFKRKEWRCYFADSGPAGLAILDRHPIDVVIADMRMPGMDGGDFLKEVEKRQPGAVRMILSGYSEMQLLLKSVKHAHQFLSKPCSSDTVVETIRRVTELSHILNHDGVRRVVAGVDSLPAIPDLYVRISEELSRPEPDLKRLAGLVERDVGVTATLMRVVNSSFFGFYDKVSSPARAVVLLGVEALKGLVLGEHLLREIKGDSLAGYSVNKLWEHSLETGYFAKAIASIERKDDQFVEDCFISGMLHDVGKLVLATEMQERYAAVLERVRTNSGPVYGAEGLEFGVSHAEVGAYLLGLWSFKARVVEAVHGHHLPVVCVADCSATMIVHAANVLQHELRQYSGYTHSVMDEPMLESLGLADRIGAWREACKKYMEKA